jgi:hypothetical protein
LEDNRSECFARIKLIQDLLDHQLASAKRVDGQLRVIFTDRNALGNSIGGAS